MYFKQWKAVHGKVEEEVGKYNQMSIKKKIILALGSRILVGSKGGNHHSDVFHLHNLTPAGRIFVCVWKILVHMSEAHAYLSLKSQRWKKHSSSPKASRVYSSSALCSSLVSVSSECL